MNVETFADRMLRVIGPFLIVLGPLMVLLALAAPRLIDPNASAKDVSVAVIYGAVCTLIGFLICRNKFGWFKK